MDFILNLLVRSDYSFRNFILLTVQKILFSKSWDIDRIKKVIVFRTGSIGDSICALPALSVIRKNFPSAQIDILTNAGSENFVSLDKLIDRSRFNSIINYLGMSKKLLAAELKENKYDLFIELPQYDASLIKQIKAMLFAKFIGVKHAFGWRVSQTFVFKKFQERRIKFTNERDRLLAILQDNGLSISDSFYIVADNSTIEKSIADVFKKNNLADKARNIGVVIGSKVERNKWPIDHFKQLVKHYSDRNFNLLIFGGKDDAANADALMFGNNVFNFCGRFSPLETAEAMKFCSVVITNDTGPMHLAYLYHSPVVAMFSSRDFPYKWYPPEDGINKVFRSGGITCSICFKRECFDNICMKKITPGEVIEAADVILNKTN